MNPPGVKNDEALDKMISDLNDIPTASNGSDLSAGKRRSMLGKVLSRIETEPAKVVTDTKGCITAVNPAFIGLCGHSYEEMKGRKPGEILQGPESSPKSIAELRDAVRHCKSVTTELVNYHKDHSTYRVRIDLKPIFSHAGDHVGFEAEERKVL